MTEFYGSRVVIDKSVKYVGEGENPADNPWMIAFTKALKEDYQPDSSKREDSLVSEIKSEVHAKRMKPLLDAYEMRYSEHGGNIVREVQ